MGVTATVVRRSSMSSGVRNNPPPAASTRALSSSFEIPYCHTAAPWSKSAFGRLVPERCLTSRAWSETSFFALALRSSTIATGVG